MQVNAIVIKLFMQGLHHIMIIRRKNLIEPFDKRHCLASSYKILSNLNADEATTNNSNALGLRLVAIRLESADICHVSNNKYIVPIDAFNRARKNWSCTWGQNQLVVGLFIGFIGNKIMHRNRMGLSVNSNYFTVCAYLNIMLLFKSFGSHEDK